MQRQRRLRRAHGPGLTAGVNRIPTGSRANTCAPLPVGVVQLALLRRSLKPTHVLLLGYGDLADTPGRGRRPRTAGISKRILDSRHGTFGAIILVSNFIV